VAHKTDEVAFEPCDWFMLCSCAVMMVFILTLPITLRYTQGHWMWDDEGFDKCTLQEHKYAHH